MITVQYNLKLENMHENKHQFQYSMIFQREDKNEVSTSY